MSETGKAEIAVAIPGSATDLVKAIRELVGLAGDFAKGGGWIADLYKGHQRKKAARNLETFRFTKSGALPHLERIIAGSDTPADLEAIGNQMAETAGEVETSITGLVKYKDQIRNIYGMGAVMLLEKLIYGPAGKRIIR